MDLDHRTIDPPYLGLRKRLPGELWMWEFRWGQPNVTLVRKRILHSAEHFFATDERIDLCGVMGCETGIYLVVDTDDYATMADRVAAVSVRILAADEVPLANAVCCGSAQDHSLVGAKDLASWLLRRRRDWSDPGPDAREIETPAAHVPRPA